jgi:carbamoyl-phosphate synthase large subunit
MGIGDDFGSAYAKAQAGAGQKLPLKGTVFISVQDRDKAAASQVARKFRDLGFNIVATKRTSEYFKAQDIDNILVQKVSAGRPHVIDAIKNNEIQLVVNTGAGGQTKRDGYDIRRAAIKFNIPYVTTIAGALAVVKGIEALKEKSLFVKTIQEYQNKNVFNPKTP